MTLRDGLLSVSFQGAASFAQLTFVSTQTHGSTHLCNILLLLHDVDDIVRSLLVHFAAVGIGITQHVAGEFDHHHLHTQTDTEGRDIVCTGVFCSDDLAFDTSLAESRTDNHTRHALESLGNVFLGQLLTVYIVSLYLIVIIGSGMSQRFQNTLISILQIIFTYQSDVDNFCSLVATLQERTPWTQSRSFSDWHIHLAQNNLVQLLSLHAEWHFVDRRHIQTLDYSVFVYITEVGHFLTQTGVQFVLGAQYQDIRLDTQALQLLYGSLSRFGLQFTGSSQIRNISQVQVDGILAQLPAQLTNGLQEWERFDIAHSTTDFGNHEVEFVLLAHQLDVTLDFVCDVRNHLNGLAQIISAAFLLDNTLVDTACGDVIGTGGLNTGETLVMSQVEVSFLSVYRNIAFAMLVRIQCSRIDVDIRVKLLDGNVIPSSL